MGFTPCKAKPDIWVRQNGNVYEYIGVYVDDVAAAAKDPKAITDLLQDKYQFKLKGTGPISFHLGCNFVCDDNGTNVHVYQELHREASGYLQVHLWF